MHLKISSAKWQPFCISLNNNIVSVSFQVIPSMTRVVLNDICTRSGTVVTKLDTLYTLPQSRRAACLRKPQAESQEMFFEKHM